MSERSDFEAWARTTRLSLSLLPNGKGSTVRTYASPQTRRAWEDWQTNRARERQRAANALTKETS